MFVSFTKSSGLSTYVARAFLSNLKAISARGGQSLASIIREGRI
jgi:hypothetical protein